MAPYPSDGTLTTDKRTVDDSATWASQSEWAAYQSATDTEVVDGAVQLVDEYVDIPTGIHRWPYEEGSGSTVSDVIGSADGTLNGPTWVSGTWIRDFALSSDGTDDYVDVGDLSGSGFGAMIDDPWSIAWSFSTTDNGGYFMGINATQRVSIQTGDVFGLVPEGELCIDIAGENSNVLRVFTTGGNNVNDGDKHRAVLTHDGSFDASGFQFYVDGSSLSMTTDADQDLGAFNNFSVPWYFFARNQDGSPQAPLAATLDEPIIADAEWDSQTVEDDYNRQPWS